jgi:hypothetical protein
VSPLRKWAAPTNLVTCAFGRLASTRRCTDAMCRTSAAQDQRRSAAGGGN